MKTRVRFHYLEDVINHCMRRCAKIFLQIYSTGRMGLKWICNLDVTIMVPPEQEKWGKIMYSTRNGGCMKRNNVHHCSKCPECRSMIHSTRHFLFFHFCSNVEHICSWYIIVGYTRKPFHVTVVKKERCTSGTGILLAKSKCKFALAADVLLKRNTV